MSQTVANSNPQESGVTVNCVGNVTTLYLKGGGAVSKEEFYAGENFTREDFMAALGKVSAPLKKEEAAPDLPEAQAA